MKHYLFTPIDSWFFKESRSMDGSGSNILSSLFPPPVKTLMGALRSQIGEKYHKDNMTTWQQFGKHCKDTFKLEKIIGYGNEYANLQAQGAWLYLGDENKKQLHFPAPSNLLKQENDTYAFFEIGSPVVSDLGKVKFAKLDYEQKQAPLNNHYISRDGFNLVLEGKIPEQTVDQEDIITNEQRLGIARDNTSRSTQQGKLYQTQHLRIKQGWSVYLGLTGVDKDYATDKDRLIRMGGEARMASLTEIDKPDLPQPPVIQPSDNTQGLVIYLLTPLPDYRQSNETPPLPNNTFKVNDSGEYHVWKGQIAQIDITIETAIAGKLYRLGGWDMAEHKPQAVKSYIPAGSCWYIKTSHKAEEINQLINKLHGSYLTTGNDRALGYGQIVIGKQPENKNTESKK